MAWARVGQPADRGPEQADEGDRARPSVEPEPQQVVGVDEAAGADEARDGAVDDVDERRVDGRIRREPDAGHREHDDERRENREEGLEAHARREEVAVVEVVVRDDAVDLLPLHPPGHAGGLFDRSVEAFHQGVVALFDGTFEGCRAGSDGCGGRDTLVAGGWHRHSVAKPFGGLPDGGGELLAEWGNRDSPRVAGRIDRGHRDPH
jgi:hypothetical protein